MAREAGQQLGWDENLLGSKLSTHYKELSGLIHGGREVLDIYTMHSVWGIVTINWNALEDELECAIVFAQLGLAVVMSLSPLEQDAMSDVVRPVYDQSYAFLQAGRNS